MTCVALADGYTIVMSLEQGVGRLSRRESMQENSYSTSCEMGNKQNKQKQSDKGRKSSHVEKAPKKEKKKKLPPIRCFFEIEAYPKSIFDDVIDVLSFDRE